MNAKVYVLDYGTNLTDVSVLLAGKGMGQVIKIPVFGVFIDHPHAKIVVDTGVNNVNAPGPANWKHQHSETQTTVEQLKLHGVDASAIDYVISTHLHYDHAGNMHVFPRAKVIVRREELEKAYVPIEPGDITYNREDFDRALNYVLVPNGLDFELVDGVRVLSTPGHTAGSQSVLVETSDGNVLYAGDAVYMYENWEKNVLPGICYSAEKQWESIAKLKTLRNLVLLPGHEPKLNLTKHYGV